LVRTIAKAEKFDASNPIRGLGNQKGFTNEPLPTIHLALVFGFVYLGQQIVPRQQ
jgi:hypothetical protein